MTNESVGRRGDTIKVGDRRDTESNLGATSPTAGGDGDYDHMPSEPTPVGLLNRGSSGRMFRSAPMLADRGTGDSCKHVHRIPQCPLPGKVGRG